MMSRGGGMNEGLLPSHALGSIQPPDLEPTAPEDGPCWRLAHALGLCTGAAAFLLGSGLLFEEIQEKKHLLELEGSGSSDGSAAAAEITMLGLQSAWLYIVGSLSFCFVDVQELVTFADTRRRIGTGASLVGSLAYAVGAVGHLDAVFAITPLIGTLGFLIGAAISSCAHVWKICEPERRSACPPLNLSVIFEAVEHDTPRPSSTASEPVDLSAPLSVCHVVCSRLCAREHVLIGCDCSGLLASGDKSTLSPPLKTSEGDDTSVGFCTAVSVELGRLLGAVRPQIASECHFRRRKVLPSKDFGAVGMCAGCQCYALAGTSARRYCLSDYLQKLDGGASNLSLCSPVPLNLI